MYPRRDQVIVVAASAKTATIRLPSGETKRVPLVKRLVDEEISVMGHIGLTPQSINQLGAYRVQGKTASAAQQLIDDAKAMLFRPDWKKVFEEKHLRDSVERITSGH